MNLLFLLREMIDYLKKHFICSIVFITMFIIGILCGIVIKKPGSIECYYYNYCDHYIYRIFSESTGGILIDRILSSSIFIVLIFPLAFSVWIVPLQGLLIFYRGFVFGTVTVILFSVYRFSGCLVWLFVLLPQTLLLAALCIVLSVLAFDCASENRCSKDWGRLKAFAVYAGIAVVAAIMCALLEFFTVCFIFRPVSKVL